MTPAEFITTISVPQVYYRRKLSDAELSIYKAALSGWEVERLRTACERHMQRSKWFPTIAELIEAVGGSETDAAVEAWSRVKRSMSAAGRYRSVDFGAAENAAVSDLGGWVLLCGTTEAELPHMERRFKAAFDTYRRRGVPAERCRHLAGLTEMDEVRVLGAPRVAPQLRLSEGGLSSTESRALVAGTTKAQDGADVIAAVARRLSSGPS